MPLKSPAVIFTAPGEVEIGRAEVPFPEAGEVLIRTEYSMISTGTERWIWRGEFHKPGEPPPPYPIVPGYQRVGVIEVGDAPLDRQRLDPPEPARRADEAHGLDAFAEQPVDQMAADEAAGSCDERPHSRPAFRSSPTPAGSGIVNQPDGAKSRGSRVDRPLALDVRPSAA